MDLKLNLLWHLGRYELVLVPFAEVLTHADTEGNRHDLWIIVLKLLERKRIKVLGDEDSEDSSLDVGVPGPWRKIRAMYDWNGGEHAIIKSLMLHARFLSAYTSHGDGPWNGVVRLIDQDFEERKYLGELPGGTRLQLVMDEAAPL